jgi:hypothetical protein
MWAKQWPDRHDYSCAQCEGAQLPSRLNSSVRWDGQIVPINVSKDCTAFKTAVSMYLTTWRNIPEDINLEVLYL